MFFGQFAFAALATALCLGRFAAANPPATHLRALFDAEWDWTMEQYPTWASSLGDRRWNDRWPDASPAAAAARQEHRLQTMVSLRALDRSALGEADRLNYDLFADQLQREIDEFVFQSHLIALDQRGGIQTESELADRLQFETVKDYEDWISRLRTFPAYMDQTIALLRQGVARKIVQPKAVMQRIPRQLEKLIVSDPTQSDFYKPFRKFPPSMSAADRDRLSREGAAAIAGNVVPAFQEFKKFFEVEYFPACYDGVGIWQAPHGDELYAFLVRKHTTTNMTPEQIHELGLAEVERIAAEMDKLIAQTGFEGSRADFFHFLRTDPRFFYSTGDELLEASRAMCKRIDPKLVKLFGTLPRMPYGVEPIPASIAPDTTTAYYQGPADDGSRAGCYYVNLYKPQTRPKWEMMALSLHEAVPGHHFQIARAMELGDVPNFRRHAGYTAYVEGWGLYSESLGDEMGLYDDPYAKFGQLTYEMWRAVRLVVDTGIHHKKWTRQQAIDYFKAHAPKSELDI